MHAPTPKSLSIDLLIKAYRAGYFPMADSRDSDEVYWVEPKLRGILPLSGFHVPRSLAKVIRSDRFCLRVDTAFEAVMRACAEANRDRQDSWINGPILEAYTAMFRRGMAHSVECWRADKLVGGLYGVVLGGAFFGESMFHRETDASKVALAHLVARLRCGGFRLLDCQFQTAHLSQFGTIEVSRDDYLKRLRDALPVAANFAALDNWALLQSGSTAVAGSDGAVGATADLAGSAGFGAGARTTMVSGPVSGKDILHWTTQTS
jgi:leucyl/phenylalanyl-tRNA---protein transferase